MAEIRPSQALSKLIDLLSKAEHSPADGSTTDEGASFGEDELPFPEGFELGTSTESDQRRDVRLFVESLPPATVYRLLVITQLAKVRSGAGPTKKTLKRDMQAAMRAYPVPKYAAQKLVDRARHAAMTRGVELLNRRGLDIDRDF